jgi:hypothetical protein
VDVYWQTFVIGATLLAAVLVDRLGKARASGGGKQRQRGSAAGSKSLAA